MIVTGKQLRCLMRQRRVTIGELALRMQITQERIRRVRREGIRDGNCARDWIEAITGDDPGPIAFRGQAPSGGTYCSCCLAEHSAGQVVVRFGGGYFCDSTCARRHHANFSWKAPLA